MSNHTKLTKIGQGRSKCNDCGSIDVRWAQRKDGTWYVAQIGTKGRWNGSIVGPHYPVCQREQASQAQWREHEAKKAAEQAEAAEINARILKMIQAGMTSEDIAAAIAATYQKKEG